MDGNVIVDTLTAQLRRSAAVNRRHALRLEPSLKGPRSRDLVFLKFTSHKGPGEGPAMFSSPRGRLLSKVESLSFVCSVAWGEATLCNSEVSFAVSLCYIRTSTHRTQHCLWIGCGRTGVPRGFARRTTWFVLPIGPLEPSAWCLQEGRPPFR